MKKVLTTIVISMILLNMSNAFAMIDLNKYSTKIYKPVAMVDNIVVTEYDMNQKMKILKMSGIETSLEDCLNQVINEIVIINTYTNKKVPSDVINKTIIQLAHDNKLSLDEFKELLKKFDIEIKTLQRHITAQIMLNEILYEKVQSLNTNSITQKTYNQAAFIQNAIQKNDELYSKPITEYNFSKNSKVKLAEIIVRKTNNIQQIFDLLKSNTSFSEIKNRFPNDVELTENDGTIGWFNFDELSSAYQEVIKNVRIHHVTEPLVADENLLFIKLLEVENTKIKESFIYPEYLKLTYDQKAKMLINNIQLKLYSDEFISKLRKNFFIQIMNL